MSALNVSFADQPVSGSGRTAFAEGILTNGDDTIILDLAGYRLSAILCPASSDVTTFTIKPYVPWANGEAAVELDSVTLTVVAGKLVAIPFTDSYWWPKIALVGDTTETADRKYGFFGFKGGSG